MKKINSKSILAKYLDHTLLKANATDEELVAFCKEADAMGVAMVAINSYPVKLCKEVLKNSDVRVGAAIGFPLGQTTIEVKVFETTQAILAGADEIDYVINIGKVKAKQYDYIKEEMTAIVEVCRKNKVLCKVIFENCYLEKEEIVACANIAKEVKPDYIKTSTGFAATGATFEDVALMVNTVEGVCKVKAAGGIRDLETCMKMIEIGAQRIGTSSSKVILDHFSEE